MPRTKKKKGPKTRKDYRQSRSNIWVQFLEDDCQTREQSYFGKVTQYNSSDSPKFIMDESDKLNFQGSGYRFLYKREIETNEFVKLYELGINAILKLNNAGKTVFALAMHQLLKAPKKATAIVLDYDYLTKEQKKLVSYGIFSRGINNLLEHHVIGRTLHHNIYHINVTMMFNGNRLAIRPSTVEANIIRKINKKDPGFNVFDINSKPSVNNVRDVVEAEDKDMDRLLKDGIKLIHPGADLHDNGTNTGNDYEKTINEDKMVKLLMNSRKKTNLDEDFVREFIQSMKHPNTQEDDDSTT